MAGDLTLLGGLGLLRLAGRTGEPPPLVIHAEPGALKDANIVSQQLRRPHPSGRLTSGTGRTPVLR